MAAKTDTLSKPKLLALCIGQLFDGDCFFYFGDKQEEEAQALQQRINAQRAEFDVSAASFAWDYHVFAEPHMVHAVVLADQSRTSIRTTDGKRFIWRPDTVVLWAERREQFEQQVAWLAAERKRLEQEQQRLSQARTKKKNKAEEVPVKTLVAAQ